MEQAVVQVAASLWHAPNVVGGSLTCTGISLLSFY